MIDLFDSSGIKVVVLGAQGVGKTSAICRFVNGDFAGEQAATLVPTFYEFSFQISEAGDEFDCLLWDTPGDLRLQPLTEELCQNASICLCCFATDDNNSFTRAKELLSMVKSISPNVKPILIQTKTDLLDKAAIDPGEIEQFTRESKAPLFRTSALEDFNLNELFLHIRSITLESASARRNALPPGSSIFFKKDMEELELSEEDTTERIATPSTPNQREENACVVI